MNENEKILIDADTLLAALSLLHEMKKRCPTLVKPRRALLDRTMETLDDVLAEAGVACMRGDL